MQSVVMDAIGMDRALMRIAHEIIEKNESTQNLCVVGIKRRGEQLLERKYDQLPEFGFVLDSVHKFHVEYLLFF